MNSPPLSPEHLQALTRSSLPLFCRGAFKELLPTTDILWNWHLDLICNKLEDVLAGRTRRLIINIPPRYGKSLIASVAFTAFLLGRKPSAQIVCASYAQDLSDKMALDTRRLMNSAWYKQGFGQRLVSPRARLSELTTPEGGYRLATSVDGMLTGRGGDFIIIDDPMKPSEAASAAQRASVNAWYDSTVATRTNDKERGAIVVIMQRLGEDDLVGHLLEQGGWELLSLPAIAEADEVHEVRTPVHSYTHRRAEGEALHPGRESLERIEEARVTMGSYAFAAQYQQRPAPAGGGEIKAAWFRTYDPAQLPKFTRKVQSWDTAAKDSERSDYSVCTTWGETEGGHFYLLDVCRKRLLFPDLKRSLRSLAELHNVQTVLIEDCSSGTQLIQDLQREGFRGAAIAVKPKGSKYERLVAVTPHIEAGKVWLPSQGHWKSDYLHEAEMFPNGRYDDQLDSTSQALTWLLHEDGPSRWLRMMKEVDELRRQERDNGPTPTIRVNHTNPGMQFHLFGGRQPKREEDGTFLVTREELTYMGEGIWVVEGVDPRPGAHNPGDR